MRTRPPNVLVNHLTDELVSFEKGFHSAPFRERVLRLVEIQDSFRRLCVAIAVEEGYSKASARDRIRQYLLSHPGKVIDGIELGTISGISEYARRIREIRNEEGLEVLTAPDPDPNTGHPLRPDQYLLLKSK